MTPIAPLAQFAPPPPWRAIGEVFRSLLFRWWLALLIEAALTEKPPLRPPKVLPNR